MYSTRNPRTPNGSSQRTASLSNKPSFESIMKSTRFLAALLSVGAAFSLTSTAFAAETGPTKGKPEGVGMGGKPTAEQISAITGKPVKDKAEMAKLREEFKKAREEQLAAAQKLRDEFKSATEDRKAEIKKELAKIREEWAATQKQHAQEAKERAKQIREEFKNRERDRVVDAAADAAASARGR